MASRRGTRERRRGDQSGAAAVEFALIVPILLLLLFGIMDFGFLINRASMVNNAARDAVREASLGQSLTEVEAMATTSLSGLAGVTVDVTCEKEGGGACAYGTTSSAGDIAIVTVNYTHDMITPVSMFFGDSIDVSRSARMRIEG